MFEVFSYLFSSPPNKKIVWEKKPSINPFLEVNMKCIFCSIWVYRSFDVWPNEWMNSSKWMRNGSIYVEMNDCLKNTFAWYRVFHKHSALVWSVRPSVLQFVHLFVPFWTVPGFWACFMISMPYLTKVFRLN